MSMAKSHWHGAIALHNQELYTRPPVLKERWQEDRTGSSSLNFFQVFFNHIVVESSQPPAAKRLIVLTVLGFNMSTLVGHLHCLPGKGRKEIEEIVEEMKEKVREEREQE